MLDPIHGVLSEVGVYPIFLAYLVMGYPKEILATAIKHETGADVQTSAILKFDTGLANISCGFRSSSDMVAKIYGTNGSIFIDKVWHESEGYRIVKENNEEKFSLPKLGKGFTYEIKECLECIGKGMIESDKWSQKDSLNLISICDEVRDQIGLKYPFE